jgi:glycosyltransferase involved in cell wall biosynthesis
MRVVVVAEFYPRNEDPVLGVWAHRQAVAARDAGADVRVVVLHRVVPAEAELRAGPRPALRSLAAKLRQPRHEVLDGIGITYAPFVSPPRGRSYGRWGAWAAPALRRALRGTGPFDLVHAHNAIPAGDAVRRAGLDQPLVVSVHGGDVFFTAQRWPTVTPVLTAARLVLANSEGVAERTRALGAGDVRVVRLGTDVPPAPAPGDGHTLVTVGHLVARKGHADVLRALATLPGLRYEIVGDGPERGGLEALADELGVADRVVFHGQLDHARALATMRRADLFVMPSWDEAFGVAYVEAMAAGLPAIGLEGEPGPAEIARAGGGIVLVPPRDPATLAGAIADAQGRRDELGAAARQNVQDHFTWEQAGRATVAAYEDALR